MFTVAGFSLDIFAIICIIALMVVQYDNYRRAGMGVLITAMLILICLFLATDGIYFILLGKSGAGYRQGLFVVKTLFFILNALVVWQWSNIITYNVWGNNSRKLRQRYVYLAILVANVILVLLNTFLHFIFDFNSANEFVVYPVGMAVITALNYLVVVLSISTIVIFRKKLNKKVFICGLLFMLPPLIAEIIQVFTKNVISIRCFYALSALLVFQQSQQDSVYLDGMTGLSNRRKLNDVLEKWFGTTKRGVLCGIMLDVDGLKHINDTYGHVAGDNALIAVSGILRGISNRDVLATRYGGDEFVLVWRAKDDGCVADVIAELEAGKSAFNKSVPAREHIDFSLGSFSCPLDGTVFVAEFIKSIDDNMYIHKKNKKLAIRDTK